jgi:regulator of replication initiation timing
MDQDDELARLKAMNADLLKISADLDAIVQESKRLKAQNQELREALQLLCDYQNGPPLYKYEQQWTNAMNQARAALNQSSGD